MSLPSMTALKRMSLANVRTGEVLNAQYNPTKLKVSLKVVYERIAVPGLSHEVLQYKNTSNITTELELFCASESQQQLEANEDFQRFLQSLCYASEDAQTVVSGGPPRVLFVWPRIATLTCVITSLDFDYEQFDLDLAATRLLARVGIEEIRDVRLTSEQVRVSGLRRASTASNGGTAG